MKKLFFLLVVLAGLLFGCRSENGPETLAPDCSSSTITLIRNCTGEYLRIDGKDWLICNYQTVSNIAHNAAVAVRYQTVQGNAAPCMGDRAICMMAWPYEGIVRIEDISPCNSTAR